MKILVAYIVYLTLAVLHKSRADLSADEKLEIIDELQDLTEIVHPVTCTNESATTFECCISPKLGGINRLICHIFEVNIEEKSIDHYLIFNEQKLYKRKLIDEDYCRLFPLWPRTKICKNTINAVIDLNSDVPTFDVCFEIKILFLQHAYIINQQYKCFGVDKEAHFFAHDIGDTNQQHFGFLIRNKLPLPIKPMKEEEDYITNEVMQCPPHCLSIKGNTVVTYEQEVTVFKDRKKQKAILTLIHKLDLINDTAKNSVSTDSNVTADAAGSTVPTAIESITDTTVSSAIVPITTASTTAKTVQATTARTTKRTVLNGRSKLIPSIYINKEYKEEKVVHSNTSQTIEIYCIFIFLCGK